MTSALAIIPARMGSKGLPRKNLLPFAGKPLLAHTIETARRVLRIKDIIVSTDTEDAADVARQFGAHVPGLRPAEISADDTPMIDVLQHCLEQRRTEGKADIDAVVLLQPTSPLRTPADIDACLDLFVTHRPDCVVTIVEVPHAFTPSKVLDMDGPYLTPVSGGTQDPGRGRQTMRKRFARNGPAVAVLRPDNLTKGILYGDKVVGHLMPKERSIDIDDGFDFFMAERALERYGSDR